MHPTGDSSSAMGYSAGFGRARPEEGFRMTARSDIHVRLAFAHIHVRFHSKHFLGPRFAIRKAIGFGWNEPEPIASSCEAVRRVWGTLGCEIKEEASANGRRRGTFAPEGAPHPADSLSEASCCRDR